MRDNVSPSLSLFHSFTLLLSHSLTLCPPLPLPPSLLPLSLTTTTHPPSRPAGPLTNGVTLQAGSAWQSAGEESRERDKKGGRKGKGGARRLRHNRTIRDEPPRPASRGGGAARSRGACAALGWLACLLACCAVLCCAARSLVRGAWGEKMRRGDKWRFPPTVLVLG